MINPATGQEDPDFEAKLRQLVGGRAAVLIVEHGYVLQTIRTPGLSHRVAAVMIARSLIGQEAGAKGRSREPEPSLPDAFDDETDPDCLAPEVLKYNENDPGVSE